MRKQKCTRNKGSVAILAFVGVIPLVAAIGGFAVDCMHVNDAKGELQRATDAAALAGAEDLNNYKVGGLSSTATAYSAGNQEPVNFALAVAGLNAVDGPIGLWQSSSRQISATVRYDPTLSGSPNWPNRCDVTGNIFISSLFAKIFGNFGQRVSSFSSAAAFPVNQVTTYAPLLVSWVDKDPSQRKLSDLGLNSEYTVEIKDNDSSNSVWLWNNNTDRKVINYLIDPSQYPGFQEPPVKVADHTDQIINSDILGKDLKADNGQGSAGQLFDGLLHHTVVFLITDDSVANDLLARGQPVHRVIGFIALYITKYDNKPSGKNGYSLTGNLVPLPVGAGFDPTAPQSSTGFSPYQARLIQ